MTPLSSILSWYLHNPTEFETARDEIHALGPTAMKDVLSAALNPQWTDALDLLVMCLADVRYPPALAHMRHWMEHDDAESIGIPAASAIDHLSGNKFDVLRFYSGDWAELPATLQAIGAWWDGGNVEVSSESEWLTEQQKRRAKQVAEVPPPATHISPAEQEAMRPELIKLVKAFRALPSTAQHRLEHEALTRVLPIYGQACGDDSVLRRALEAVERYCNAEGNEAELLALHNEVEKVTAAANNAAGWNSAHNRYQNPHAKAAAHVAQGILYLCSPEPRNRLQGLHYARNAMDYAGYGALAVSAELARQLSRIEQP